LPDFKPFVRGSIQVFLKTGCKGNWLNEDWYLFKNDFLLQTDIAQNGLQSIFRLKASKKQPLSFTGHLIKFLF